MNVKLFKLVSGVLDCLSPASVKRTGLREEDIDVALLTTLKKLLGPGPNEDHQLAFRRVHTTLLERTATIKQPSLFDCVRHCISLYTSPLLSHTR